MADEPMRVVEFLKEQQAEAQRQCDHHRGFEPIEIDGVVVARSCRTCEAESPPEETP